MRGNVPALTIVTSTVACSSASSYGYSAVTVGGRVITVGQLGTLVSSGSFAYESVQGNQPSGKFALKYKCESNTVPVNVSISGFGYTVAVIAGDTTFSLYQYLRLGQSYHQIINITSPTTAILKTPYKSSQLISEFATLVFQPGGANGDAEYGAFYSNPADVNGVSIPCYDRTVYSISGIPIDASVAQMIAAFSSIGGVISSKVNALSVTRSHYPANASFVGYTWTITFLRQNGNLHQLGCDTSLLGETNVVASAQCVVSTQRNGTLVDGHFELGMSFPHVYVGVPVLSNSTAMPWNIDATGMQGILQGTSSFGTVTVTRQAHTPTGTLRTDFVY